MSEPEAHGWMPIETAPKDGTMLLLFTRERCANCPEQSVGVGTAYWHPNKFWCNGRLATGEYTRMHHAPSHWQPLPQPPTPPSLMDAAGPL